MSIDDHKKFMTRAMSLALKGQGITAPNPYVGATIVKRGRIVGEGYHRGPGKPHAEVVALRKAGRSARGSTMYLNLEPCCHQGRTGPCSEEIIRAGVSEVHFAATDPNPLVNGGGARSLRKAGIKVSRGPLTARAIALNELYRNRYLGSRPFVTLKTAQTLDGRIAGADGVSQWISGDKCLRLAHTLRAESDAVVIGAATAEADNPQLTVRKTRGTNPYRIVLSTSGRINPQLRLFRENNDRRTIVALSAKRIPRELREIRGLIIWQVEHGPDGLLLADLLRKAWDYGINSMLVEGGGRVSTSFLREELVDRHIMVIAPMALGEGPSAIQDFGHSTIKSALRYKNSKFEQCGNDIVFTGYPIFDNIPSRNKPSRNGLKAN
ncbi:MAG: bifunctional diaminohydroxyphosphoribosylaminopyrimidine deaminase/5-amino-6-(5-phosphoribosylamino)uracil reductase RibD [candidate division Zixibacteria bacterium]|nr:bifunctional diaminohydroxyphosphoribosylaminopyrimidine deaminase/5-amino-6-(5-phosphoribosylamino)uracil reductase RibD [candidate division Zixibacteria bacterium]